MLALEASIRIAPSWRVCQTPSVTNPYNRIAITVVRLIAAGFLVVGFMNLGLYWFKSHHDHADMSIWRCLYLSIPLVIGVAILVKSSALAQWVDQYLDE
jgi:hypothetical protein